MSVSISGPKGYEFQYRVTVLLTLLDIDQALSVFVEKKGTEDAELRLKDAGGTRTIDVQVKNGKGPISLKTLTEWLCHFEECVAVNNLLDRVISKGNTCLFVAAGRCDDHTSKFVQNFPVLAEHDKLQIKQPWVDAFAESLIDNMWDDSTILQKERHAFCEGQGNLIKGSMAIEKDLRKVIIWDHLTKEKLDEEVKRLLNTRFKIPQSVVEDTYLSLLEAVRNGRDNQTDILPDFKNITAYRNGEGPVIDLAYQQRNEESYLKGELTSKGILLLSGYTQCGKTEIAKQLANHFFNEGYAYRIFSDVSEVSQFFNQNQLEDKVCVLEDPWGHIQPVSGSADSWRRLSMLIRNKRTNHKLIVTSRSEIVTQLAALVGVPLNAGSDWTDITVKNRDVLKEFWQKFVNAAGIKAGVAGLIDMYLDSVPPLELLQVGQLQHLARMDSAMLDQKNTNELLHFARQTSAEIAGDLLHYQTDAAELLTIICTAADTITPLSLIDLGFLLSSDTKNYSIMKKSIWSSGFNTEPEPFPAYDSTIDYSISSTHKAALEYLERRGFINILSGKLILSHPNYYEAGRYLYFVGGNLRNEKVISYFERTINCVNPANVLHAVKQFGLLITSFPEDHQTVLYELICMAMGSAFPAVADLATVFLVGKFTHLPAQIRVRLLNSLETNDTPSSHIFWNGDIPYISSNSKFLTQNGVDFLIDEEVKAFDHKLSSGQNVTALEAWEFLNSFYTVENFVISIAACRNLMQYGEVFIRKRTASVFFAEPTLASDTAMIEIFFADEHPSVVFASIRAALRVWHLYTVERTTFLKKKILKALSAQPVAVRCNQLLTDFSEKYRSNSMPWIQLSEEETKNLWNLWGELFAVFSAQLPSDVFFNPSKFGQTMNGAFMHMEKEVGMKVARTWFERIDYKTKKGHYLDESELSLADYLIEFTGNDAVIRRDLMISLLDYPNTNFQVSTLKWVINQWENLSQEEKDLVLSLANSSRSDKRWLKAIILFTYQNPPAEIQNAVLGVNDAFSLPPGNFIKIIDSELLSDCLLIYLGRQPFWWLAAQYRNKDFWQPVVYEIIKNQIQPYFDYCLSEMVNWGLNGFSSMWEEGQEVWDEITTSIQDKTILTQKLIEGISTITTNIDCSSAMCQSLFNAYKVAGNIDEFVGMIVEKIEMLQETGDKEDLFKIFDDELLDAVVNKLIIDSLLIRAVNFLKQNPSDTDTFDRILDAVINTDESVRFFATKPIVKKNLNDLGLLPMFEEKLSLAKDTIKVTGEADVKLFREEKEQELPGWLGNKQ